MKLSPLLITATLLAFVVASSAAAPGKPNILLILADDLGLDGLGCYGSDTHPTPAIDRLAASGTRFQNCYAAPLCGPSRCLLMTGRYAFRTGGLTNLSWRPRGAGAKSAEEQPMAKLLKQAGYATCQAGKWRQMGETPKDWGFDEYCTDPNRGGYYWKNSYEVNGQTVVGDDKTYNPDVIQKFTLDFVRRHQSGAPFFIYYAMHLVHKPTEHTPDSSPGAQDGPGVYQDNIAYIDKQVGELVGELEELGLRENTLVIFSGDNGTQEEYVSKVQGRMLDGHKGTMQEGGARVPFIASWPGTTPAGRVCEDLISFADPHLTFLELAGATPPSGFKLDGQSFAPQLRGEKGKPREYTFVQLGQQWYVKEAGFKMDQAHTLFDMSDAPFTEKPVAPANDTAESKAARERLTAILASLNPASGKQPSGGEAEEKEEK